MSINQLRAMSIRLLGELSIHQLSDRPESAAALSWHLLFIMAVMTAMPETPEPDAASADAGPIPAIPAIPTAAGALIFDRADRLLVLKPTYKTGWTIPGGVMEADGETPWQACRREVREECGIDVRTGRLACMDFRRPRPGRPGGIRFLFDCGRFDDEELADIVLQPEEISEYRLAALPDALALLRGPIRRRVRAATRSTRLVYLEDGRAVPGVGRRA
jgi:8-oxo-dGTP diphosphatase